MKVVETKKYYLDIEDKKKVKKWLIDNEMTLVGLADKLEISLSYVGLLMNGQRPINEKIFTKLNDMGLNLKRR